MGEVDLRTLPQTTIRKVIRECVEKGLFDSTLSTFSAVA